MLLSKGRGKKWRAPERCEGKVVMTGLFLPQRILETMIAQAEAGAPGEVCGLLAGQDRIVREIHRGAAGEGGIGHYSELLDEQCPTAKEIGAAGLEVLAVYQSHPTATAWPSEGDIHRASKPGVVYLVLSLLQPWRPELRGFRIHNGEVLEVPIQVFNDRDYEPEPDYMI
jgi:proteasome lid subunit RPN8/RPN11